MNVKDKYFRLSAKSLILQFEKRELYKQIRAINRKQDKLHDKERVLDAEVRQMFNDGVFTNYSHETWDWVNKLQK